jgi:hypothetical protein
LLLPSKLRSLADVASYIKQNQHLPEVPSAAEVAKEGMGLVEMNTIAIKKIEELTLYLIEQHKKLEVLQQQVAQQQEQLSRQKQEIIELKDKSH